MSKMKIAISSKGEIELPDLWRRQDGIEAGQLLDIERLDVGQYLIRQQQPVAHNAGLVDWLLACPEKGWFVPTDD